MNGAVLHPSPRCVLQLERNIFVGVGEDVQSGRFGFGRLGLRYAAAGEVPELALLTLFETHDLYLVQI